MSRRRGAAAEVVAAPVPVVDPPPGSPSSAVVADTLRAVLAGQQRTLELLVGAVANTPGVRPLLVSQCETQLRRARLLLETVAP